MNTSSTTILMIVVILFTSAVWNLTQHHYVKSARIRSFSGPHFPTFGLNTGRYSVRMRENTDQKNSEYGHFPHSSWYFFLRGHHYNSIRSILFKDLNSVDRNLIKLSEEELTLILLYGSTQYSLT